MSYRYLLLGASLLLGCHPLLGPATPNADTSEVADEAGLQRIKPCESCYNDWIRELELEAGVRGGKIPSEEAEK